MADDKNRDVAPEKNEKTERSLQEEVDTQTTDKPPTLLEVSAENSAEDTDSGDLGQLLDLEELRLSQDFEEGCDVEAFLTAVPVKKPGPQEFFRVHPDADFRLQTMVLELKEDREIYVLRKNLWRALEGEAGFGPRLLLLCVNRAGVVFIWPLRLPREDRRSDRWAQSALAAANEASTSWVRIRANMDLGAYEAVRALGELPEPTWPGRTFEELFSEAFKEQFITSPEHPVLQRLRGEV